MIFLWLALILGGVLWGILVYNGLIKAKNLALEAWSCIDVQLKRRADLIPSLVEVVKGYAAHEKKLFERVAETRATAMKASDPAERGAVEGVLSGVVSSLLAVAENYPDLKADKNFQDLQKSLSDAEDQIQMARRYYNGTVREMNIKVKSFPDSLVAKAGHFEEMKYFELEKLSDRGVPNAGV